MSQAPFHLLINADSAAAHNLGQEKIEALVAASGISLISFDYLPATEFNERLKALIDSPFPILIGGGDGTIALASELHLHKRKPFGIIPMGTMNLLAIDLHLPADFAECLEAYKDAEILDIDIGLINKKPFLCCVSWGTMPEAARFREKQRGKWALLWMPKLATYVFQQMDKTYRKRIRLTMDGFTQTTRTAMLIVSNNLYSNPSLAAPFRKGTMSDGILGVYKISPRGFLSKILLFINLKRGKWHKDPYIREHQARQVTIDTFKKEDLISIDGEPLKLKGPYHISLIPRGISVLLPKASVAEQTRHAISGDEEPLPLTA